MRLKVRARWAVAIPVLVLVLATSSVAYAVSNFGIFVQQLLRDHAQSEFGVIMPLEESSARQLTEAEAEVNPLALVTLSQSLRARVVTSTPVAQNIDMIALWPNSQQPTHLIACNEAETTDAGLIRVGLKTGQRMSSSAGPATATRRIERRGARSFSARKPAAAGTVVASTSSSIHCTQPTCN